MAEEQPKQSLNIRSPALKGVDESVSQSLKTAVERKMLHKETFDEAWTRILSMKNSEPDQRRLYEVKQAMENGEIERDSESSTKRFSKAEALRMWRILDEKWAQDRLRKMVEDTPDNYWLITDEETLDRFVDILSREDEIVFDVETTGVDVWEDYIVGNVLTAVNADIHSYIPTKHDTDEHQLEHALVMRKLKPIYENNSSKYCHNGKFDLHMLDREGVEVNGFLFDTQEAMKLLNENEPSYALKRLVTKYIRWESQTYGELFGKKGFNEVPLDQALAYAAKDGEVTLALQRFQSEHLSKFPEMLQYYKDVESPLTKVLMKMERVGYDIDLEYAEEYGEELKEELDVLGEELTKGLGDINIQSPAQLKPAIEKAIGKDIENTDAKKTLKPVSKYHPIVKTLLDYREISKLYNTYIKTLPTLISNKTGKLHTSFNQNGAKTGRLSSGGGSVNLQNQPDEARKLFIPPKGYVFLGGDWSQQEYRALTYFSQEPRLYEVYNSGKDLYSTIAAEVFDLPIEECGDGSEPRNKAKVILLAVAYGTGARTLSQQLGNSQSEAKAFLKSFDKRFPVVKEWIESNREFVQKHGFVWMDGKKRKRRLPDARKRDSDYWYTSVFTMSTNAIIQGSSSQQTKATLIALDELCERKGDWYLSTAIHDEALVLVPEDITKEEVKEFEGVMVNTYKFGDVPNKCDLDIYAERWGESVSVEEWFSDKKETIN